MSLKTAFTAKKSCFIANITTIVTTFVVSGLSKLPLNHLDALVTRVSRTNDNQELKTD